MKHLFRITQFIPVLYIISISHAFSQGVINVQNGNINHFYQDFAVPGHGFALKLERSYNSLSTYEGMFGHKWGSNFDMDFKQTPEGTIEITEFGGGFKTTFSLQGYSSKNIDDFIENIFSKIPAASKSPQLRESLKNDPKFRHKLAKEYKVEVSLSFDIPLYANDRGPETLVKSQKREDKDKGEDAQYVWVRTFPDGKKQYFNHNEKLVRHEDVNRNYLKLSYDKMGLLSKVTDTAGRQITFTYDSNKKVSSVTNPLGKTCSYKYDANGDLIYAKNKKGYEFIHKYSDRHLMSEVKYPKGEKEEMHYDEQNRITLHAGPEDIKTRYQYDNKGNPDKYFNVIVTKEVGKKPNQVMTVDKYEYEFGRRDNGTRYTYRLATVLDGVRTETIYTSCCGKPISIERQGKISRFEYFSDGTLKKKIFPNGEMVSLDYDKKFRKVSQVTRTDLNLGTTDITFYQYDTKGNLAYAQNKKKKIYVQLIYDTKGRIKKLLDQSGKKIEFSYNELGKPIKITLEGVGSIVVSYNAGGEITNVKSTGGRKIATEVTATFQTLLDVIRPAGVSLNI